MSIPDEPCTDLIPPPDTDRISREVDPDLDSLFALTPPPVLPEPGTTPALGGEEAEGVETDGA